MSHEGLSSDSGHWIKLERARLKEKRKEREREREEEGWQSWGRIRWPPWPAAGSSPESSGWGAMVHSFRFRKHREREESDASPFSTISAVGEAVSTEVHGDAKNDPPELAELGLRATIDQTESTGRKREAMRTR